MKAIRKPIEEEIIVLRPNINSIKECYLFLNNQKEREIHQSVLDSLVNDCLKNLGLKYQNKLLPFNSVIVKSDITITSFSILCFKQIYNIREPDEIQEARNLMKSCSSDIGFMGSPDYSKAEILVKEYEKVTQEMFKE